MAKLEDKSCLLLREDYEAVVAFEEFGKGWLLLEQGF